MFDPWIGHRFGVSNNSVASTRLLILGESHYPDQNNIERWVGQAYKSQTVETIQNYAIEQRQLFFRKLSRLVSGEDNKSWSDEANREFWHSIAFYNFVPVFIKPPALRGRPTASEWEAGKDLFSQVLKQIDPDITIVCGLTLWWYVMDSLPGGIASNPANRDVAQIGRGKGLRIPHITGSRGAGKYKYEVSRPQLISLIESHAASSPAL